MDGLGRLKYAKGPDAYSPSAMGNCPIYVIVDENRTDLDYSGNDIMSNYTCNSI
jgi:hypothetical protein